MFKKLSDWTRANRTRFGEIGVTFALVWLWVTLITTITSLLAAADLIGTHPVQAMQDSLLPRGFDTLVADVSVGKAYFWTFVTGCVLAPLVEEMFRAGLCELCTDASGKPKNVFLLLSGSFLGFGLLHGGGYYSILIQGSLGLLLARLWFRTGPSKAWSYLSNVFVHAAYNFCVIGIQLTVISLLT